MKNGTLTHFSLCSGIGGLDLAAEWAGFETAGQCEIDKYASRVLAKNFEGVKNYGDIRTITAERLAGDGVGDITVLSAGIPCQPYSLAGKGLGDRDSRDLEQELVRVVGEVRPKWLVVEGQRIGCESNSIGAVVMELIGYIFVNTYAKNRSLGAFEKQTLNVLKRYWFRGEK